ncbi:type VI secretion system-associated FHA domain protein TagH [Burkholderia sp. Bp9002]|nr:type VI secretion system-associated FHA domain protein TagH [Burkholderia sp. Bp9002]
MQLIVIEHAGEPVGNGRFDAVVFHPPGGTIGRDSDNHLVLRDDSRQVSRLQALLQVGDDACLLRNLSSVSTIEVNREPIGYAQERPLQDGDIVRIGPYVLRAEREAAARPTVDVPAGLHADPKGTGNRLWGLLQDRFARGKVPGDAAPRGAPAAADAERPASRATTPQHAPAPHDLNHLSTDPLDLFAQPSADAPGHDTAHDAAPPAFTHVTPADHAPEWTQHVRVQPASTRTDDDASCTTETPPTAHAPPSATPDELLRAFFEGAGLDAAAEPHEWSAEQLFIAGQLLALFANGTVELLSSRSILKREVKAHMTMLLDRENNPLKLLPDGGAVLRQMFGLPLPGFMSPQSAVSDAFQDLHAHQIGMVAGMRAALMDLLTRFSPQRLRERDDAPPWYEKRVPMLYKARLWDRYAATHRDTVFAIEDDFASVFGKAFLAAYDAEVESYRGHSRH